MPAGELASRIEVVSLCPPLCLRLASVSFTVTGRAFPPIPTRALALLRSISPRRGTIWNARERSPTSSSHISAWLAGLWPKASNAYMPRKLIAFHAEDLRALNQLAEDRSSTVQELVDEAIRGFLDKSGRPTNLRDALRASAANGKTAKTKRKPR